MRFITAVIAVALPLAYATGPCDPLVVDEECKFVTFEANSTTSNYLEFPTNIVGTGTPDDGERSYLPPFEPISSCPDDAVVRALESEIANVMQIQIVNDGCVRPIDQAMSKIHASALMAHFVTNWGSTPSNPCLARYDVVTGESTCIQACSDDPNYVCYIGVNAYLTLLEQTTTDEQDCNDDANLPVATEVPIQPKIQALAFSTSPTNQLDLTIRTAHYTSRVPPTISIGSSCTPKTGEEWSAAATTKVSGKCINDWSASFHWADIHSADCYSESTDILLGSDPYQRYDYVVTVVEQDELYIRPDDDVNFAMFRTTTTSQSFSLYAKESADDNVTFTGFDYSNVVSIVTSATMSVESNSGTLVVKVYSSVQNPFVFQDPTALSLNAANSSTNENWGVTFDEQGGAQDDGGDTDVLLQFTLETSPDNCTLVGGSFHFSLQVECAPSIDPSNCPIPDDSYETLNVTINVPSVDLCPESSSTDLTATLHIFGSEDYEDRQAFFTEGRDPEDYVYVAAVLSSPQVSVVNCAVSAASAIMEGGIDKDLLAGPNAAADWEMVYENKIASLPSFATDGQCVAMYRFTPVQSIFNVPYDTSKVMTLTMTIGTELPSVKRSLSAAVAEASITLTNPASSDNGDDASSSDASHVTASLAMLVAGAAILLL